jgi:hypothetical protein
MRLRIRSLRQNSTFIRCSANPLEWLRLIGTFRVIHVTRWVFHLVYHVINESHSVLIKSTVVKLPSAFDFNVGLSPRTKRRQASFVCEFGAIAMTHINDASIVVRVISLSATLRDDLSISL